MPLPSELTPPPVTNTNLVCCATTQSFYPIALTKNRSSEARGASPRSPRRSRAGAAGFARSVFRQCDRVERLRRGATDQVRVRDGRRGQLARQGHGLDRKSVV